MRANAHSPRQQFPVHREGRVIERQDRYSTEVRVRHLEQSVGAYHPLRILLATDSGEPSLELFLQRHHRGRDVLRVDRPRRVKIAVRPSW